MPISNLPDDTYAADPRAPWNQPDPWVGHTCGDCKNFKTVTLMDKSSICVCVEDIDNLYQVFEDEEACEYFEE